MEKLKFTCKHCNQKLEADLDLVGEKVLCPACQNELVVSAIIDESYIVLQENIKKYPDLSDFDRAELLINKHEFNAAHYLLQITNLSPNDHLRLEIEFFCQKKEWESAKNLAELYIKLYPDSAIGYRWLAEILDDGFEEREKAIATATKAIELDPKFAEAYVIRGNTKRWLSPADNEGAEEDYNTALQIDSTLGRAYVGLGWIYYDNGDYIKATKKFTESFTYDKGTGYGAWQGLALVLHKLGKLEAAAEAIGTAISKEKAWYLYESEARILYDMALQIGTENAETRQGAYLLAFKSIGNAAALAPFNEQESLFTLAGRMILDFLEDK